MDRKEAYLNFYEAIAPVQTLVGTYQACIADDLEYKDELLLLRLIRNLDDRMVFEVHTKRMDGEGDEYQYLPLYHSVWRTHTNESSEIKSFDTGILSTIYSENDGLTITNIRGLWDRDVCKLQYPLDDAEYFQRLTQMQIPEEEWINRFMYTGQYVIDSCPMYNSVHMQIHLDNPLLNETSTENVVQYVMSAMKGLLQAEVQRLKDMGH